MGLQHVRSTWHRSQHFRSTRSAPGNLYASRNVGVDWRVIPYNIYRISKLLARYTRTNSKNMRFAARSQHSSSDRSTFAAPQVVSVKIHGSEINEVAMIRISVKSQRLTPSIREDILILRNGLFSRRKKTIFVNGLSQPFNPPEEDAMGGVWVFGHFEGGHGSRGGMGLRNPNATLGAASAATRGLLTVSQVPSTT